PPSGSWGSPSELSQRGARLSIADQGDSHNQRSDAGVSRPTMRWPTTRLDLPLVEPNIRRLAEEDVVARRVAERRVDAEHRNLDLLARFGALRQQHLVGRVEARDRPAPALAERQVDLAVDPHLAVIVHRGAEPDLAAGHVHAVDLLRDRDLDPVPAHAE